MVDKLYKIVLVFIETALSWLPRSPFADGLQNLNIDETGLGWLSWFFPVHDCLVLTASWIAAIALFYLASIILRWVKVIE